MRCECGSTLRRLTGRRGVWKRAHLDDPGGRILDRYMPNYGANLDPVFRALSNATRRAVVGRLGEGPAAVSELAEPFDMALPSFLQHLEVLEQAGVIESRKDGRVRMVRLTPLPLQAAEGWISEQRSIWERRFDQLDDYLLRLDAKESNT